MNWKKFFYGNSEEVNDNFNHDRVLNMVIVLTVFVSLFIVGFIISSVSDFKTGGIVDIPVIASSDMTGINFTVNTEHGSFVTGEGLLSYKSQNFMQILLFKEVGGVDIFKLIFFLFILIPVYFSLNSISDEKAFNKRLQKNLYLIGIFTYVYYFFLYPYLDRYRSGFIKNKTGNTFSYNDHLDHLSIITLIIMVIFLGFFIRKGNELQQEKDLTI